MSLLIRAQENWESLSVADRAALLADLKACMADDPALWDELPAEMLAHVPDFDSLPGDLCGHLIMALTPSGFRAEKFGATCALFRGAR